MVKKGKSSASTEISDVSIDELYQNSVELIEFARESAVQQVNIIQLMTYYSLGKWIVEQQQGGNNRAQYGRQIIKKLSQKLNEKYGKGFSKTNLEYARKFFITIEFQEPCSDSLLLKKPKQRLGFWKNKNRSDCHGHIT